MFSIILVFILRESLDRSDNPTSRQNMNSHIVRVSDRAKNRDNCIVLAMVALNCMAASGCSELQPEQI